MCQIKQQGLTLIELTIVIAIIGVIAVAIIPSLSSGNSAKLDLAAQEIANAARFAKTEALRTGIPHGIDTSANNDRVRVYSLAGFFPTYDVRHPIDKKLYDIDLTADSRLSGVKLDSALFSFDGSFSSSSLLGFSSDGIPKYSFFGTDYMLSNGTITLKYHNDQRVVSIAPMTGRVTIQ